MIRALLRLILIIVIVVGIAAFFVGYRFGEPESAVESNPAVGTRGTANGTPGVDVNAAREAGAAVGERVAAGANEAERLADSAAITAKIKAKMALDDIVDAVRIDIDTSGSVVTLRGTVESEAARLRAVTLARETEGVSSVIDRLQVK